MDGRRNNKGTKGNKGGRPSRATEEQICLALQPMEQEFKDSLLRGLVNNQGWAVKLYADYYWGKPKESLEVTSEEGIKNITFTVVKTNQDEVQD